MPTADPPQVRRAASRFRTDTDWLSSAHSFSFGPHYDPADVGHGRLMVSNHEILRSGSGFDDHPHSDAEIVTWMLSGSLVHADSAGRTGVVHRGLAQRMSAGSGIVHAEVNDGYRIDPALAAVPAEYVQMWVRPDAPGGESSYEQAGYDEADLAAGWVAIASGHHRDALIRIGAQATLWVTRLPAGDVADPADRRRRAPLPRAGERRPRGCGAVGGPATPSGSIDPTRS